MEEIVRTKSTRKNYLPLLEAIAEVQFPKGSYKVSYKILSPEYFIDADYLHIAFEKQGH